MTPWLQSLSEEFGQNAKIRLDIDNSERTVTLSVTMQLPGRRVGTQYMATLEAIELSSLDVFEMMVQRMKSELEGE
jgi:hypothetical protein